MTPNAIPAFLNDRRVGRALLVLFIIVIAVLLFQTVGKANRPQGNDFASYLLSAKALANGEDPYHAATPFPYLYPLVLAFVLIPLTWVPYPVAVVFWYFVNLAGLIFAVRPILETSGKEESSQTGLKVSIPIILFLLFLPVIQNDLLNGQVNCIVLFLTAAFWRFMQTGKKTAAGLALAAAIGIKLVPAVFLWYLLVKREWRLLATAIAALGIFCFLPAIFIGGKIFNFYAGYCHDFLAISAAGPSVGAGIYSSLSGFLRWVSAGALTGRWVIGLSAAVVIGVLSLFQIKRSPQKAPPGGPVDKPRVQQMVPVAHPVEDGVGFGHKSTSSTFPGEWSLYAAYLLGILLILPGVEIHHLIYLLPGLALAIWQVHVESDATAKDKLLVLGIMVFFYIGDIWRTGPFFFLATAGLMTFLVWAAFEDRQAAGRTAGGFRH